MKVNIWYNGRLEEGESELGKTSQRKLCLRRLKRENSLGKGLDVWKNMVLSSSSVLLQRERMDVQRDEPREKDKDHEVPYMPYKEG